MITEKEQNATLLSPVKKDFYQIWNELLETSKKLSERWDPTSTNEADPGIVLLKVLTACSDKLNYNIDKNILEAFMPSAAQEDSMRKLCDLLGYSMGYYKSATTTATISYIGDTDNIPASGIYIPAFTNIKSEDNEVNYLTLNSITLNSTKDSDSVEIIEGTLEKCATETDNIITISMLDDNHRYVLPEVQIAENGIYVYSLENNSTVAWEQVSNLNTIASGKPVYKFGFNSLTGLPYLQFPDDVANIIGDGLYVYYIRTKGINGNISARTLSTFEKPEIWSSELYSETYSAITVDMFSVVNASAAMNGTNKETIEQAYESYKKIIGTFDTLITCRDYMNKIYNLTSSQNSTNPIVSNIIVSDIKDDINRAITLCTFGDYGIKYEDKAVEEKIEREAKTTDGQTVTIVDTQKKINNFDIILYPFKTVTGLNNKTEFDNSFKYTAEDIDEIRTDLDEQKTLSHNFKLPNDSEIVCIKNYLKLNARITTTSKVNSIEGKEILNAIKTAIYTNFNARKLDFGEEIPYDKILECIEQADERIKNVSLDEPELYTAFELANGNEYSITGKFGTTEAEILANRNKAKEIYNKIALRNILAGRIALFNYSKDFKSTYKETAAKNYPDGIYPTDDKEVNKLEANFNPSIPETEDTPVNRKLTENEVIQFRAPNFKTTVTYPAYVNYFIQLKEKTQEGIPATFISLKDLFLEKNPVTAEYNNTAWENFIDHINTLSSNTYEAVEHKITDAEGIKTLRDSYFGGVFKKTGNIYSLYTGSETGIYYTFDINNTNIYAWRTWSKQYEEYGIKREGLFKQGVSDDNRVVGKYVDSAAHKYTLIDTSLSTARPFESYFIQKLWNDEDKTHTKDGLGKNAEETGIKINSEYKLDENEYLLINYTKTETNSETNESKDVVINLYYGPDTTIRPNFVLSDSKSKRKLGNKYNKTSDFDFRGLLNKSNSSDITPFQENPEGLYSLGTNEQIEIREKIIVKLDDLSSPAYIYFIKNDNSTTETDKYIHLFEGDSSSYTLQANEYFFYTNKNKLDVAYYGNGTEICRIGTTAIDIKKPAENDISEKDIEENGMDAIPWISYYFTNTKYLEIRENKYISLTEGDTLVKIKCKNQPEGNKLSKNWVAVESAEYQFESSDSTEFLPEISIGDTEKGWEVCSKLELNAGPANLQRLNKDDSVNINYTEGEATKLEGRIDGDNFIPLAFKTNYFALSGNGNLNTTSNLYNSEYTLITDKITDFKVKVFEEAEVQTDEGTDAKKDVNLNNFGANNWSSLTIDSKAIEEKYTTLHISIPETTATKDYSIIMFYYLNKAVEDKDGEKRIWLNSSVANNLAIFNYPSNKTIDEWTWWTDTKLTGGCLKDGINIVKINKSCELDIYRAKSTSGKTDVLIFSNPDIIRATATDKYGLNLKTIDYQNIDDFTTDELSKDLLNKISALDPNNQFYYNNPVDNSSAIDINDNADPAEKLSTETIWYDYNNINNKFVISEIDSDYLDDGIVIAKSSRLY